VRAAAAEVALALRDIHLRLRGGSGIAGSPEEDGAEGLSAGRLFGDLEFLERSRLNEDASAPVSVSDRAPAEWIRTGVALLRAHRYREAHESLRQALQADPADKACRRDFHLALGYEMRDGGWLDEALESFSEALKADPECVEADAAMRGIVDSQKRAGKKGHAILGRLLGK
jgi:Tfp pilus assembly protein PilF